MVEVGIIVATAILGLFVIAVAVFLTKFRSGAERLEEEEPARAEPLVVPRPPRRVGPARRREVLRRGVAQEEVDSADEEEDMAVEVELPAGMKVGAKKMKKLEQKASKKAEREAFEQERRDRKVQDEIREKQRKVEEARLAAEDAAKAAEEQRLKEEQEKKEYEEYLKLKETFSVEEEGEDAKEEQDVQSLLQQFIDHIQRTKVVVLEDLAAHFKIKTQDAIDRVKTLQEEGRLSGVIDDRGKFIYITQEEYEAVAKFIKQRGRVSITELAESMNRLINLNPDQKPVELSVA